MNTRLSKQKIRAAITANRGGHKNSSDGQLAVLWRSLPEPVKKQYLESVKEPIKKNDK